MERLATNPTRQHDMAPDRRADLTLVENQPYLPDGGIFLPDYEGGVEESNLKKSYDCKHGQIEDWEVKMEDGTQYDVRRGTPNTVLSDTRLIAATPWFTHLDLEHNKKAVRSALWLGYMITMVSAPKGFSAKGFSLSKTAYDMHRILDAEELEDNINPMAVIAEGDSRSAMAGFGLAVPQYARGREVPYGDFAGPCVSRPFKNREWPFAVLQLGREGLSLASIGLEYGKRGQLLQYARGFIPSDSSHAVNGVKMFPALVMGEAGKLAEAADPNMAMHIVEFKGDYWRQKSEWKKKFKGRGNVLITEKPGTHIGGIARTQTRRDRNARLGQITELRGFDGSFDGIDFAKDVLPVKDAA